VLVVLVGKDCTLGGCKHARQFIKGKSRAADLMLELMGTCERMSWINERNGITQFLLQTHSQGGRLGPGTMSCSLKFEALHGCWAISATF